MAIESKNHRQSPVKGTTVSQGGRADAKAPKLPKFDSYQDEKDHLIVKKKELESQLSGYSKAALQREQFEIRKAYQGDHKRSHGEWMRRRAQMSQEREKLVKEKIEVETRLMELKRLVRAEVARNNLEATGATLRQDGSVDYGAAIIKVIEELAAIRKFLEESKR